MCKVSTHAASGEVLLGQATGFGCGRGLRRCEAAAIAAKRAIMRRSFIYCFTVSIVTRPEPIDAGIRSK
jgi:hypothetical protein